MKSQGLPNRKRSSVGKKEVEASPRESTVKPTDIIWVKNRGGLWWPGQVVDENLVSESNKPSKRSAGKVLVRLYGTYTYSYVDPIKWRSEFDMILEQNNSSYREIFMRSLEQHVARLRAGKSKEQRSKSKGKNEDKSKKPSKSVAQKNSKPNSKSAKQVDKDESTKKLKKNSEKRKNKHDDHSTDAAGGNVTPKSKVVHKKLKLNSPESISCSQSQELTARRIRVMQSLGLAAPTGSPFCRNGQIFVSL